MRNLEIVVGDTMRMIDQLEAMIREKGIKHWTKKIVQGEEHYKRDDEIRTVVRVFDWKNRHRPESYYEFITKTDSGEIIRSISEKFAEHVGYGSAKHITPDFPAEWIAVCAYFIWEKEGRPNGRHINHWNRAKNELRRLWKAGMIACG
jgi:hypothetical protein